MPGMLGGVWKWWQPTSMHCDCLWQFSCVLGQHRASVMAPLMPAPCRYIRCPCSAHFAPQCLLACSGHWCLGNPVRKVCCGPVFHEVKHEGLIVKSQLFCSLSLVLVSPHLLSHKPPLATSHGYLFICFCNGPCKKPSLTEGCFKLTPE